EFPNPGYIDLLVGRYGGENNAFTTFDYTAYYLLLPSDQLDLALRIEADRMTEAAIDPKQLAAEKTVVLSELEGDNNDNASFLSDNVQATAFQYHPYHYPIIGTKWDVQHFTRAQVYDYYRKHYAPNNATLVIVGDFDTKRALARVRQLWSEARPAEVPQARLNPEPPQRGERRVIVRRAGATAHLQFAYHIPGAKHPDLIPLAVLETALAEGRSSRLYRALVETQLATSVGADASQCIDPTLFEIWATARAGVPPEKVEAALLAELARLQTEPLSERELQKAKNQTRAAFIYAQDSVQSQAARLGFYQTVTGDWRYLTTYLNKINAVTAAEVLRVAQTYLGEDNRTVGIFLPSGKAAGPESDSGGAGRAAHYRPPPVPLPGRSFLAGEGEQGRKPPPSPPVSLPAREGGEHGRSLCALPRSADEAGAWMFCPPSPARNERPGRGTGGGSKTLRLKNGLTVIVRENHANPTVVVSGFVRAGAVNDPPGKFGLADLVAEMLTRGTTTRTSQQIAETTDFVGASIDIAANRESTDFHAEMLTENFDAILGLLADCLRNPAFPAEELEKARGETLTGLQEAANDTATVATWRLYEALYPANSPYPHPPEGRSEDVRGITRDDLRDFYRRAYRPENVTLVIVGDVKAEAALASVEKAFGDWKDEGEPLPAYAPAPVPKPSVAPAPIVLTLPDKEQSDVAMGLVGLARKSKDYEAAMLMNLILGGDEFVGRIGKRVRDTEGLAYYAYTSFAPGLEAGPWMFRAGVNPRNIPRVLASAKAEIRKMVAQGVTDSELAWAKDHAIGALRLSLATNKGMAEQLASDAFYGLGLDYAQRMPQIVRGLTKAQVNAAARAYLRPEALTVVIAGPPMPAVAKGGQP
ncbi:MAG TPA: pitrilysin family protein, partial [Chthonomonadaceae bacterium]|nr:pitrilysin family protein [Chthonomonadaceae bacterium]